MGDLDWIRGHRAEAGQQAAALAAAEERYPVVNGVAIVDVQGVLAKSRAWWADTSMSDAQRLVEQAAEDPVVAAILLRVDSPGGTVAGVSDLAEAVYAARKVKPVSAYISDLGASAAYYIASQAQRLYADSDALVGSIGVYSVVTDWSKFFAEQGIKVHVVKAGALKGAGTLGTEITDEHLADWQREVEQLNETFVEAVARGRGWSREKVSEVNDGRVHVGRYAVRAGLVDEIASFGTVVQRLTAEAANRVRALRALALAGR